MDEENALEIWRQKLLHWKWICIVLTLTLLLTIVLSSTIGPADISPIITAKILASRIPVFGSLISENFTYPGETIVLQIRLPRIVLGLLVGASLGMAGTTVQAIFRNPMAEPYTVGVSAGAALGAVSCLFFGLDFAGLYTIPMLSFAFAIASIFLVLNIAKVDGRIPVGTLLLAGISVSLFLSAIVSIMMSLAGEELHGIFFWIMGGLWNRNWTHVQIVAPVILVGSLLIYSQSRGLDAILLGEEPAYHLGIRVERMKRILLILSSLITAAAVSVTGIIGFVGLIIPHMMRILVGSDHFLLFPAAALGGGIFLVWADSLARSIIAPVELPVGIITALAGGPFFIYLLKRRKYEF